jgi:hypothetical protein
MIFTSGSYQSLNEIKLFGQHQSNIIDKVVLNTSHIVIRPALRLAVWTPLRHCEQ